MTVIFHDYFSIRGGGERLVLELARALKADLTFGYTTDETYEPRMFPECSKSLQLPPFLRRRGFRPFALAWKFSFERNRAKGHRIRVYSGVAAPFAAPAKGSGVNIFYCHTPPRFLFDQRDFFLERLSPMARLVARPLLRIFEFAYRRAITRMDVIVTNSNTTKARIEKYLGLHSTVVYPPCDTSEFVWKGQDNYYLSTARLSALKRVDLVVRAFKLLPSRKLVVVSGGEDRADLMALAHGHDNIVFRDWVSDEEMQVLMGNAVATIYVPRDEDFGMSAVESMSAGKPVIGVAEGGLLETISHDETGILLPPDPSVENLIAAVEKMSPELAMSMRNACEQRAQNFSSTRFATQMQEIVRIAYGDI